MIDRIRAYERNKVIDELIERVELKYLGVHPDELYEPYYPNDICKQVKEIAEQLRANEELKEYKNEL